MRITKAMAYGKAVLDLGNFRLQLLQASGLCGGQGHAFGMRLSLNKSTQQCARLRKRPHATFTHG